MVTRVYETLTKIFSVNFGKDSQCTSGSISNGAKKFFSLLHRPDRLCDPPRFLFNGYRGLYPRGQSSRGLKLRTHLHLAASLRMRVAVPKFLYSWRV